MAANSKGTRGIASLGKRVVNQIWTRDPTHASSSTLTLRRCDHVTRALTGRASHTSVYDKNPDDLVRPTVVPDDVIEPQSDKYWAPHPQTGVFGPATEHKNPAGGDSPANGGEDSVLEEKAWFRPTSLEDLEKPHHP